DFECEGSDLVGAVQSASGRIPIWVVGVWPRPKSMRRGGRCGRRIPPDQPGGMDGGAGAAPAPRGRAGRDGEPPGPSALAAGGRLAGAWAAAAVGSGGGWKGGRESRGVGAGRTTERVGLARGRVVAGPPAVAGG